MLLVDGDHGYRGALLDIRNMRALAKPGAVLLVDDLDEGPGPALRQAQAEGLVEILDIRMFNASTVADEVNPCVRRVRPPCGTARRPGDGRSRAIYRREARLFKLLVSHWKPCEVQVSVLCLQAPVSSYT